MIGPEPPHGYFYLRAVNIVFIAMAYFLWNGHHHGDRILFVSLFIFIGIIYYYAPKIKQVVEENISSAEGQ